MESCKKLGLTLSLSLMLAVYATNVLAQANTDGNKPSTSEKTPPPPPAQEKKKQHLTPEQREDLRRQIESAGKEIYPKLGRQK